MDKFRVEIVTTIFNETTKKQTHYTSIITDKMLKDEFYMSEAWKRMANHLEWVLTRA